MNTEPSEYLTLEQVSELLHVHRETVRKWARLGYRGVILRTVPAGRHKLTKQEWIDQWHAAIANRHVVAKQIADSVRAPSRQRRAETQRLLERHGIGRLPCERKRGR